ncbi:hypothetical protein D3C73_809260 [compost metagenome]
MRPFDRATEVAEHLQVRRHLIAQAQARGVVPVTHAGLAATLGIGHGALTTGVDGGQAGGQPQVVGNLQVIACVQDSVRTLIGKVAHVGARCVARSIATGDAHQLAGPGIGQVLGHAQAHGGAALQAPQGVAPLVVERAADIGVRHLQAVGAFAQIHRIIVPGKARLDAGIVIEIKRGLVADEGAAWLLAPIIARHVGGVGCPWVVLDGMLGHPACEVVVSLAVAQVEACFQVRVEAIAEIGDHPLALAGGVVLIAIGIGVGQGQVVVKVTQYLAGADLPLLIAMAARCIAHLQAGCRVAGVADVIDGTAQRQGTAIKTVGAAQHFHMLDPQRFEQFVRCATGAGQRQAVEHRVQP